MKTVKVAITGAAGQIGYSLLFRVASGQMFGPDTAVELNLIELEDYLGPLNGVAMELEDCAFPLLKKVTCTSSLKEGMDGINWAILVGSVPRKDGIERSDLLEINGKIFTEQGKAINKYAAKDVHVLVVGNPCNTNALIAMNNAPDIPPERFFAMTMLDELRAKAQLANKANVDITKVKDICIWGNHSATQFPDFFHATIDGKQTEEVINDIDWLSQEFIQTVQQRGATVIKARGLSSAASAANAIIQTVNCIIGMYDDRTYSVCRVSRGEYGVDEGLIFSFPSKTTDGVSEIVTGITHNEFAIEKIHMTLNELRQERDMVNELGLI